MCIFPLFSSLAICDESTSPRVVDKKSRLNRAKECNVGLEKFAGYSACTNIRRSKIGGPFLRQRTRASEGGERVSNHPRLGIRTLAACDDFRVDDGRKGASMHAKQSDPSIRPRTIEQSEESGNFEDTN